MTQRLLLVEDDDGIAVPLVRTLLREGYAVERVATGADAVAHVTDHASDPPDAVLLDLGLPDMDGLDVCQRLRDTGYSGGVMIVTARGGELDRVLGLDVGADDYLIKPFLLSELLARVRALLRRSVVTAEAHAAREPAAGPAGGEDFRVDGRRRQVWVAGTEIPLNTKEFDLLAQLTAQEGVVVTREQLMERVWDENWFGSTKVLDVTMARLRRKLEDAGAPLEIVTVRSVGFRLDRGHRDA